MQNEKPVILTIDDDQDVLDTLNMVLSRNDFTVVQAHSAEEGLKAYKQAKPDLVIVDLMMEEVDAGTHFVQTLRAQGNQVPVYMLSSVGDSLQRNSDYTELGLSGVFQKPIEPRTLLSVVQTKLKQSQT